MATWDPWQELERRDHLELAVVPLPRKMGGGCYLPQDGWAVILLDEELDDRARRAVLAHELIHDEGGGGVSYRGQPPSWTAIVIRDEERVESEVATRLVPFADLSQFCAGRAAFGLVTADEVAEEFEVPVELAERALRTVSRRQACIGGEG